MTGYIYAIAIGSAVKIGWSADPAKRLSKLQSDNPERCELLGVMAGSQDEERQVHRLLSQWKLSGEWFRRYVEPVDAFISSLAPLPKCQYTPSPDDHPLTVYRKTRGLTLEAFGDMVGVQKAAVSKWEDGHGPSIENAVKIEQATGGDLPRYVTRPDVWSPSPQSENAK